MAKTDPLNGKLVVLFGGSGFLGTHVAQTLLERGVRLRIASRHPEEAFSLRPLAKLGQLQFVRADIRSDRSVDACTAGADGVINLVGAFDGDLMKLMGDGAGRIARSAAREGASAMVQVSAIGADADSQSSYARAKAEGERQVREAFPRATILRPSVLFGEDDKFVNMFAGLISSLPVLPVFAPHSKLQMLYVDDAAEAVATALANPERHGGKLYEIAGPEPVSMLDLHRRIARSQGRDRSFIEMPDRASALFAKLPLTPMGTDQWLMLKHGNTPSGDHPGIKQLGIEPKPLDLFLDRWMVRYRKHGRFSERTRGA